MTAPIIASRVVPCDDGRSWDVPRMGRFCRLCDKRLGVDVRESRRDRRLCAPCAQRLDRWQREAEARSPHGVGLYRMEGAWPLGELWDLEAARLDLSKPPGPLPEWVRAEVSA